MLLNYNAIGSILSEPFFLSSLEAERLTPLVAGLFTPNLEFERLTPDAIAAHASVHSVSAGSGSASVQQRIGVVDIRGVLTKYDTLCAVGMSGYGSMIRSFADDSSIDAIVLRLDSPGGSASGTEELGALVSSLDKPCVAFVSDMAGSAAYWVACCCREIVANNTTAVVGSIGVMATMADMRGYYESQGIVIRDIYPVESPNKNRESRAARAGNDKPMMEQLSVLARKFQSVVRTHRPSVTDDQLLGTTYFAQDVVGSLIDSVGTFEYALSRAASLALSTNTTTNSKHTTMATTNYSALAAAAGATALESQDGSISLTADQATATDLALSTSLAAVGKIPQLQTRLKDSLDANAKLTSELQASQATVAELTKKIDEGPGAAHAGVSPTTDSGAQGLPAGAADFGSALAIAKAFINTQN